MRKLLFILSLIFVCSFSFSQQGTLTKNIKINSSALLTGGEYVLIPTTLGRVTYIEEMTFKYVPKSTVYTIASTDSVTVKTDTPDGEVSILLLTDSTFVKNVLHLTKSKPQVTYTYSNDVKLDVPVGKLEDGDGDLYIEIKYTLEK